MSADRAATRVRPSKLAVGLAAGASAAVCAAAVTGGQIDAVELVGALGLAAAIGAISFSTSRPPMSEPHVLTPITSPARGHVVHAPRAGTLAGNAAGQSDAA